MSSSEIELGKEFKPDKDLKKIYYLYTVMIFALAVLSWLVPLTIYFIWGFFVNMDPIFIIVSISCVIPSLITLLFILYWIPKYYQTIEYKLTENDIEFRSGVWFKKTGTVPYNKITNIDISQGPIARKYNCAGLKLHTAGYSAQGRAEITLSGIINYDILKDKILSQVVKQKGPVLEKKPEENMNQKILSELIKIRELLERS
ncbi:MAG: PH domain-containing protein [Candidatus Lokiarchaeota archaeon]|nr:PH domain-containing protein [Candidatus Lokiarchaeota archaeon]